MLLDKSNASLKQLPCRLGAGRGGGKPRRLGTGQLRPVSIYCSIDDARHSDLMKMRNDPRKRLQMEKLTVQLLEHIRDNALPGPDDAVDSSIRMWEALAAQLIPVVGADGFQSLYDRCIHLTSKRFAWLAMDLGSWDHSARFSVLRDNLNSRHPAEAATAGLALLTTFIETLVELVGAPLVGNVLRAAWD
jgi:hypothetical protein